MKEIKILVDGGKYKWVTLPKDEALKLLEMIEGELGRSPRDLQETMRYLRHFDEFYRDMKKRFKDFIAPSHSLDDMIRGVVVVDKVALKKEGDQDLATIVFDRRVKTELLKKLLEELGYKVEIEVEKLW
ncbi:hypothetical protein IPA_09550 [Ignicoccus pacificus DSM 13166]|uniref:Uncharacterized protein n=1 Tax=Ignicoccus pacificus DSM 13166 TaxID=940294 RepID=A0A977KC61_9CREN|nr:hypothetical protein IPA_09550 [Ignicoccus pacificus DSM 13166]